MYLRRINKFCEFLSRLASSIRLGRMCQGAIKEKGRMAMTDCYNSKQSKNLKFQLRNKLCAAVLRESVSGSSMW